MDTSGAGITAATRLKTDSLGCCVEIKFACRGNARYKPQWQDRFLDLDFFSSESNYLVCPGDKSPSLGTFAEIQMASMHSCLDWIFMTISWATGR